MATSKAKRDGYLKGGEILLGGGEYCWLYRCPTGEISDARLPFAALQLLAPPVRLVSAALWKVLQQRDVMQYGVVEEFVTSACETVPGLLTQRHQGKLALGLRARLILELCRTEPDVKVITQHLQRIRAPVQPSSSFALKKDVKIQKTVETFHLFAHSLLTDPAAREHFFKEQFPVDYGPKFDQELEKLLWEFLIRLDQLLPVPNLAQTVAWLSEAPPVLEECAQAATQPQLLKILLQHQMCLGHLEMAASLPPNMGESILTSLSLLPSGRVNSNLQTGIGHQSVHLNGSKPEEATSSFITPVIGLISNEDVPFMSSTKKRTPQTDEGLNSNDATNRRVDPEMDLKFTSMKPRKKHNDEATNQISRRKRKQAEKTDSETEEEEDESAKRRTSKHSGINEIKAKIRDDDKELLEANSVKKLPDDPSLHLQPRVVIEKLSLPSAGAVSKYFYRKKQNQSSKNSTGKQASSHQTEHPGLNNKENRLVLAGESGSSSQQQSTGTLQSSVDNSDYVADSEDEGSKNFKSRLFMKRYYRTKHGTYVPTLREFWKPAMTRRDPSAFSKLR